MAEMRGGINVPPTTIKSYVDSAMLQISMRA